MDPPLDHLSLNQCNELSVLGIADFTYQKTNPNQPLQVTCTVKGYDAFKPTTSHVYLQDSNGIIGEIPTGIYNGEYFSVTFQVNDPIAFGLWCYLRYEESNIQVSVNAFIIPQYYGKCNINYPLETKLQDSPIFDMIVDDKE